MPVAVSLAVLVCLFSTPGAAMAWEGYKEGCLWENVNSPTDLPAEAESEKEKCDRDLQVLTSLGKGAYGSADLVLNKTGIAKHRDKETGVVSHLPPGGKYVLKKFEEKRVWDYFDKKESEPTRTEPCMQQYVFENIGMAPQVFASWKCGEPAMGFLLMQRMGRRLMDLSELLNAETLVDPASGKEIKREDVTREVTKAFLGGLEALYSLGCMHQDLHDENIMFDLDGRLRFVDFGLAHCEKPGTKSETGMKKYITYESMSLVRLKELDAEEVEAQKNHDFGTFKILNTWKSPLSFWNAEISSKGNVKLLDWLRGKELGVEGS
uniref:Protein kinase domain-containing protein n=1 Tax=Chromera velia CCMP2878 TaxID=1169474 RepID=A0A0G4HZE8_9ALVE|eukprot:Cvel_9717.t1-p1 / transcript=Cvel_9717.t1 / gene=Cvel_9717 / organism=Chromera_velia_CCMP2878 / gene_product=hypothetical protein / transcript_product=hypothetical protein / location=Cvel_scaffold567:46097-48116(+) / protein_length=321 / sequence_SO=supercontig / SO=protein_coding / is_pseudo=false